jgi:putative transcriptional regulator
VAILVRLDVMMARRKISGQDLAERIGLTQANLSKLKTGRVKAVRFRTLARLCQELDCQPGDLLEYDPTVPEPEGEDNSE